MKPLLLTLLLALPTLAQTTWQQVAATDTMRIEIYGAELSPTGNANFITVWMRTTNLRMGRWRRNLKMQFVVECSYGIIAPVRIGKANSHSAQLVDHIYKGIEFEPGSLGWKAISAACNQVYGDVY